jgi:hypothetical protein
MLLGIVRLIGIAELLFAFGALALSLAVALWLGVRGRGAGARRALMVAALVPPLHLAAMALAGAVVRDRTLPLGGEKKFCDVDCDLGFSVLDATPGAEVPGLAPPAGTRWWRVTVRVRSDAARARMYLGGGRAEVADERGRRYVPSTVARERASTDPGAPNVARDAALDVALDPGQSAEVRLVFALPSEVRSPRLLITSGAWPSYIAAGDENAWFHGKTWLALT